MRIVWNYLEKKYSVRKCLYSNCCLPSSFCPLLPPHVFHNRRISYHVRAEETRWRKYGMRITRVGLTTLTIKEKRKEGLKLLPDLRPVCCGKQLLTPNRPVDRPTDRPTQGTIKELLQTTLNRTVDLELFSDQLGQRVIEAADEFEERMKIRREKAVEPAVFRVIGAVCIKTRLSFLDSL